MFNERYLTPAVKSPTVTCRDVILNFSETFLKIDTRICDLITGFREEIISLKHYHIRKLAPSTLVGITSLFDLII